MTTGDKDRQERRRARYAKDPEAERARARAYRAANPDRVRKWSRTNYEKHHEKIIARGKAYRDRNAEEINRRRREYVRNPADVMNTKDRRRQLVRDNKKRLAAAIGHPKGDCARCGWEPATDMEWVVLDFHHRNRSDKHLSMTFAIRSPSMEKAIAEARKCDLLCANCHRIVEAEYYVNRRTARMAALVETGTATEEAA